MPFGAAEHYGLKEGIESDQAESPRRLSRLGKR